MTKRDRRYTAISSEFRVRFGFITGDVTQTLRFWLNSELKLKSKHYFVFITQCHVKPEFINWPKICLALFLLGIYIGGIRGEKALYAKWKITSVRLARSDIDTDKIEPVNWQTVLFFFFFFFVGKNDTKYQVLLFFFLHSKKKLSYPTAYVLIFNHSKKSSFTRSTRRIWRPRFVLRTRVGSHADRIADLFLEKTRKVTNDWYNTLLTCGSIATGFKMYRGAFNQ